MILQICIVTHSWNGEKNKQNLALLTNFLYVTVDLKLWMSTNCIAYAF